MILSDLTEGLKRLSNCGFSLNRSGRILKSSSDFGCNHLLLHLQFDFGTALIGGCNIDSAGTLGRGLECLL